MKSLLLGGILLLIFGVVGKMDYEDAIKEEATYCDMVASKVWPAYKGECNDNRIMVDNLASAELSNSSTDR